VVISTEVACIDNAMPLDCLTSDVALEEPEIGSTDQNRPIDNNCTNDALHFVIRGGCEGYDNEGDGIGEGNAIPTTSRRQRNVT
jgi:hypothetical protein